MIGVSTRSIKVPQNINSPFRSHFPNRSIKLNINTLSQPKSASFIVKYRNTHYNQYNGSYRAYSSSTEITTKKSKGFFSLILKAILGIVAANYAYVQYQYYQHKEDEEFAVVAGEWQMRALKLLPLGFTSYVWGKVAHTTLPTLLRAPVYKTYSWLFDCNLEEMSEPLESYSSLGEFFARRLKTESRIIEPGVMVSPVDGTVLHLGEITTENVEQVKGVSYQLSTFLGQNSLIEGLEADRHKGAKSKKLYHCIIYLAPGDYHGIHSPVNWKIHQTRYFPGFLFPVAPRVANFIEGLFAINERVVMLGNWENGFFSLTAVGATNVGSIVLTFDPTVLTNTFPRRQNDVLDKTYSDNEIISSSKGEEVAFFHMGSTVVLIFQCPEFEFQIKPGQKLKLGQQLGELKYSESHKPPHLNEVLPHTVHIDDIPLDKS